MTGRCPHCGGEIEMVPEVGGATLVVDAKETKFAILYPNGYAMRKTGHAIHACEKAGKDGHIVK